MKPSTRTILTWLVLAGLFLGFDLIVLMEIRFSSNAVTESVATGVLLGQIVLIATWTVLGRWNAVVRIPCSFLLLMMIWYAFVIGTRLDENTCHLSARIFGLVMITEFSVAVIPLGIAKRFFRWRLTNGDREPCPARSVRFQFQLRHLFVATTLLAIALTPLPVILPMTEALYWPDIRSVHHSYLFCLLTTVALTGVPCVWGALSMAHQYRWHDTGWVIGSILLIVFFSDRRFMSHGTAGTLDLLVVCTFVAVVTVFATLLIVRALGFRLIREPARGQRTADASPESVLTEEQKPQE